MIGLSPRQFWSLSLRELWNEFAAAKERLEQSVQRDLALAWHIEALHRQKQLPELSRLLRRHQRRPQTIAEQRGVLEMLSAQMGIPLRKAKAK